MNLAFLTSCLEPGKDGVGDYTRLLAEECHRAGHHCCVLALNDRFITAAPVCERRTLETLRLGSKLGWPERTAQARQFISSFGPDWLSVQFVGYGFHPRGIAPRLAGGLRAIASRVAVHLMLHELWIGAEVGATLKDRVVGALQRRCVLDLVRKLAPRIVHTSNGAYQNLLQREGISAQLLPLFGGIPVTNATHDSWLFDELQRSGVAIRIESRRAFWLFGFFGTLHPAWPPEPLFSHLQAAARQHGKHIVLAAIGRMGAGEALWHRLAREYAGVFRFCCLGERSPENISAFLNAMDFGMATTPYEIIGKSGTVAAMLEHGLPVIVNRDDVHYRGHAETWNSDARLLIKMGTDLSERLARVRRRPRTSRLPAIARQLLNDLHDSFGTSADDQLAA